MRGSAGKSVQEPKETSGMVLMQVPETMGLSQSHGQSKKVMVGTNGRHHSPKAAGRKRFQGQQSGKAVAMETRAAN